jgi:hypothetical protein
LRIVAWSILFFIRIRLWHHGHGVWELRVEHMMRGPSDIRLDDALFELLFVGHTSSFALLWSLTGLGFAARLGLLSRRLASRSLARRGLVMGCLVSRGLVMGCLVSRGLASRGLARTGLVTGCLVSRGLASGSLASRSTVRFILGRIVVYGSRSSGRRIG